MTLFRKRNVVIFSIIALALFIRLLLLERSGLWSDELFSIYYAKLDPSFIWNEGLRLETNPPFYYLFLHYWIQFFGSSALSVRLPSVLFSLGTVWFVILIGRQLSSHKVGLVAGFLAAVASYPLYYAQEARAYSLMSLDITVAILGFIRFFQQEKMNEDELEKYQWQGMGLYALGSAMAIHAHFTGFIFVLACNFIFVLSSCLDRKVDKSKWVPWIFANVAILLLTIPLLAPLFSQVNSANLSWIPHPTFRLVLSVLSQQLLGASIPFAVSRFIGGCFFIFLGIQLYRQKMRREEFFFYVALPAFFILSMFIVSLWRPILLPRTALWVSVPLCLLTAKLVLQSVRGWNRYFVLASVTAIFCSGLFAHFTTDNKENWEELSQQLQMETNAAYTPIFSQYVPSYVIEHYAPGLTQTPKRLQYYGEPPKTAEISVGEMYNPAERVFLHDFIAMTYQRKPMFLVLRQIDKDTYAQTLASLPRPPDRILTAKGGVTALIWR